MSASVSILDRLVRTHFDPLVRHAPIRRTCHGVQATVRVVAHHHADALLEIRRLCTPLALPLGWLAPPREIPKDA